MPERPKRSSSLSDNRDAGLEAVLNAALKALRRGDGLEIEPRHHDRLRADCETLGVKGDYFSILIALRRAFSELTSDKLCRREDVSYAGLCAGQTLYQGRWESTFFSRTMYVKFALTEEGLELFTFHEHREED